VTVPAGSGTVPGSLGLWQSTRSLGQSREFGTVPEAQDSPRPSGLSQRKRIPTPWGFICIQTISRKIKP